MKKLIFFSLVLICFNSLACEPDSVASVIKNNLDKYNEITISSTLPEPYIYSLAMNGFITGDTTNVLNVSQTGIVGFWYWGSDLYRTCKYVEIDIWKEGLPVKIGDKKGIIIHKNVKLN